MFEVRVHKKRGKVYLRDGWAVLKDVYKIGSHAWVTLTYLESNLMHMIIKDKSGLEVDYPNNGLPPILKRLIPSEGRMVLQFYRTNVHLLTASDVNSGYLVLPWFGFCEDAMPKTATRLSIIDHYGNVWKCEMVFMKVRNTVFCRIGGQWSLLRAARNLMKGHAIKLAVTGDSRNGILHIRHVPLQCVHRGFTRSATTTESRYVYQRADYNGPDAHKQSRMIDQIGCPAGCDSEITDYWLWNTRVHVHDRGLHLSIVVMILLSLIPL
ncbi:hypothetical protein MTR_0091s0090 [Medicago truncatula]|uniref:Uncharacterized protein n=1 Tax=Medicago truncatula TaxID=3880 RepID=A0A072TIS6_MEDTR|nr:hypothetical protein MTR_0091s0090 [Medicago truncatula]